MKAHDQTYETFCCSVLRGKKILLALPIKQRLILHQETTGIIILAKERDVGVSELFRTK